MYIYKQNYPGSENPNRVRYLPVGKIRRYSRAEIRKVIEVEGAPEGGGDNRERRSRGYKKQRCRRGGGSTATIERGRQRLYR